MNTLTAEPDDSVDPANDTSTNDYQVLSMIFFAIFAIVATVLAFIFFPPGGVALAIIFAIRGFGPIVGKDRTSKKRNRKAMAVRPDAGFASAVVLPSTGNVSFDAYRTDMLERLESERRTFEDFLGRLRAAKDMSEFDQFLDDRAAKLPGRTDGDEAAA